MSIPSIPIPMSSSLPSPSPSPPPPSPPPSSLPAGTSSLSAPILSLPPELLDLILSHVPADARSYTAASLAHVFPSHPPAPRHLWRHVVVGRPTQLNPMWKRLREDEKVQPGTSGGALARTYAQRSWKGDADIVNNVLRCLPLLDTLILNIGTNFMPEHLQEMFEDARPGVKRLEMRFRPYVETASYYQFLSGSYFDTAIETLYRRWPEMPNFTHLSIVQDLPPRGTAPPTAVNSGMTSLAASVSGLTLDTNTPSSATATTTTPSVATSALTSVANSTTASRSSTPPPAEADTEHQPTEPTEPAGPKGYTGHGPFPYLSEKMGFAKPKSFAQPIVFFDVKCLARFGASPVARNITHLRLRVPSREIARYLISDPGHFSLHPSSSPSSDLFPALRYLDLSTTNLRIDVTLQTLLRLYARLEHLVLDRVNLFGFQARDKGPELCRSLGALVVAAGLARGKERERAIAAWELSEREREARAEAERRRMQQLVAGTNRGAGEGADEDEDEEVRAQRENERAAQEMREEMQRQIEQARSRRGHRSAAMSTFSLRDRPLRRGANPSASSSSSAGPAVPLPAADKLFFVLPPLPTLKTICIGGEAHQLPPNKVADWEDSFHAGWREGLAKLLGWAVHVVDKYERAVRKADEWRAEEAKALIGGGKGSSAATTSSGSGSKGATGKAKAKHAAPVKGKTAGAATKVKPPTDVRLYRFLRPDEVVKRYDPADPTADLVQVLPRDYWADLQASHAGVDDDSYLSSPSSSHGHDRNHDQDQLGSISDPRACLDAYRLAIADAELWTVNHSHRPPCVLCTVPDCEGPARRGAEGERVDGRGGMNGKHREGCGHEVGRQNWGWAGVEG